MKKSICFYAAMWIAMVSVSPAYGQTVEELTKYYKSALPGEAFVPTPYGADARFKPKTIWLYLDNFQASPQKPKRQNAWVAASSGEAIFDSVYAPIHIEPVSLPVSSMDSLTKFGVTASLAGTLSAVDVQAGMNLAKSHGVDLDIDLGTTQVEYVYYLDMLTAQDVNTGAVAALNNVLKTRFGRDVPLRRVITAALRTRGASVSVKNTSSTDFSASADLTSFLSKLGFTFSKERNAFDKITFDDWRYIAYQSRYTDKDGKVSTALDAPPVEITSENSAPPDENAFGSATVKAP